MHAVLERIVAQFADELNPLDAEATQLHPKDLIYKWNAQQVCEHLLRGYRGTSAALQTRLLKGHAPRKQTRTYLQWSLQLMVLSFGKMPQGVPALDEALDMEASPMDGRLLAVHLRDAMERMDTLLDRSRAKFGMERVATHPWLGSLRVDQWRRFHAVHSLHHLKQLQATVAEVAPAAVAMRAAKPGLVKELHVPAQRPFA